MNELQIKIANEILKYVSSKNGCCSNSELYEYLCAGEFDRYERVFVQVKIIQQGLLKKGKLMTALTIDGVKAAKMGYSEFMETKGSN